MTTNNQLDQLSDNDKKLFEELDGVVKDLIQTALNDNNKVALVTNASLEWVYQSS